MNWYFGHIKRLGSLLILLFLLPGCVGCRKSPNPTAAPPIAVGVIIPMTGPSSHIGEWQRNGIELAMRSRPEYSGDLKVTYEDSGGVAKGGLSAFMKLVDAESTTVIISSLSSVGNAILPSATRRKIPVIMVAVSYPDITKQSEWAFRNHPGSEDEARVIAQYLTKETSLRRAAVFYLNDDFGNGAQQAFRAAFQGAGGQVIWIDAYDSEQTDFRNMITAAKATNPDVVYVIGYVNATAILAKQIRELQLRQPLACNMAMATPLYLDLAGDGLDGAYFTVTSFVFEKERPGTNAAQFAQNYKAAYGAEPSVFSAMAFDAARMLQSLGGQGGPLTCDDIRMRLSTMREYSGVMGNLTIDETRNVRFPLTVAVLHNRQLLPAIKRE